MTASTAAYATNGKHTASIADALRVFVEPGDVTEIRICETGRTGTVSGYYNDMKKAAADAAKRDGTAPAIYFMPNPVNADLQARANNRLKEYVKTTTPDDGIVCRKWLLFDFDWQRPKGISSTDAQHQAAIDRAIACQDWLTTCGWPAPVFGDSGNGAHLNYRVNLPNDAASLDLVKRILAAAEFIIGDGVVEVDQSVCNAARIWKLYGTKACKGDSMPDRPHRISRLISIPDPITPVPRDLLELVAALAPKSEPARSKQSSGKSHAAEFDLDQWITSHNLPVVRNSPWSKGHKWVLNPCPWNPDHTNCSAFILRFENGAIAAGCRHNGCSSKDWHALRDVFEPGWRNRRSESSKSSANKNDQHHHDEPDEGYAPPESDEFAGYGDAYEGPPEPPPEQATKSAPPQQVGTLLSTVKPERVSWLWRGRIPLGKVSILDGDPGLGKSVLTMDLAARTSAGLAMPDGTEPNEPRGVVILNAEDGLADTVLPRLVAAGGDPSRVLMLDKVPGEDGDRLPVLPADLVHLRTGIAQVNANLVVIDPLMAFLDGSVNAHRDQDIRRALHPLAVLAEETQTAVLVVRHLNKSAGGSAIHRGGGSIGIIGAARSAMLVARDPDDDSRRILASTKCNIARLPESLAFSLEPTEDGSLRLQWIGATAHTADSLLATPKGDEEERDAVAEAVDVLRQILSKGALPASDVTAEAKKAGVAEKTLRRAKQVLRVVSEKLDFAKGWRWRLPDCSKP